MSRDDDIFDADDLNLFYGRELEIDESKLESDFGEAVRIHREAGNALGMPEEAPSLDEQAAQQDAERTQAAAGAPFVRIAPPSLMGAKISGQQTVSIYNDGNAGVLVPVVDWHAEDVDNFGVTITVANMGPPGGLGADFTGNIWPNVGFVRPFARILWGVGGVVFTADVDIPGGYIQANTGGGGALTGGGQQIRLGAANVIVMVGLDPVTNINPLGIIYAQLGASIAILPTTSQAPVLRTKYVDLLNASASKTVPIPPFATQLYPVRRSDVAQQLLLTVKDSGGNTIDQISVAANTQMNGPLPITPDAFSITVTNQGGSQVNVRLPFGLSF